MTVFPALSPSLSLSPSLPLSLSPVPSAVTNLTIAISGPNSLTISWDSPIDPNGILTYRISLSYTDLATSFQMNVRVTENPEDNRMVLYNSDSQRLEPYARYDVTVTASTTAGSSDPVIASVTTSQGGLYMPVSVCSSSSVACSWLQNYSW